MAQGSLTLFQDHQNVESHLITLFEKLEAVRKEAKLVSLSAPRISMHTEVRTLEFWRSIISECIGTFFYVFIVCGASTGEGGFAVTSASMSSSGLMATALASGFAMATLTQCFGHISGMRKVELRGDVLAFAWRESGKPFCKKLTTPTPYGDSEPNPAIISSPV
uniref:Uncharacterized protein n=1 Tax=Timema monikensis TaxID=170555 RepID=A0A7R9EDX1_9NEOP|nr:unnamed protein product [Timema monikensis]